MVIHALGQLAAVVAFLELASAKDVAINDSTNDDVSPLKSIENAVGAPLCAEVWPSGHLELGKLQSGDGIFGAVVPLIRTLDCSLQVPGITTARVALEDEVRLVGAPAPRKTLCWVSMYKKEKRGRGLPKPTTDKIRAYLPLPWQTPVPIALVVNAERVA